MMGGMNIIMSLKEYLPTTLNLLKFKEKINNHFSELIGEKLLFFNQATLGNRIDAANFCLLPCHSAFMCREQK